MFGAHAGLHRLFTGDMGNEIAWLLPAALFAIAFGIYLALCRQLGRMQLCALVMWGGWLAVTGAVFSYMGGMIHPYYTVALAPCIAAMVGTGAVWAWRRRASLDGRFAMAAMVALATVSTVVLLHGKHFGPSWIGATAVVAIVGVLWPRPRIVAAVVGIFAALAGTIAFSIATASTPHQGSIPSAIRPTKVTGTWMGDEAINGQLASLLAATHTQWSAATNGSQSAAALEIASGTPVMAIGGWSGDPVPTLQQFIDDVHAGKISYYVEAGRRTNHGEIVRSPLHSASQTREIADWVARHYPGTVMGESTVYSVS
jgi:4-amino-4-deoxy-L-arabinose transferase-like glycosyltransferase